MSVSIYEAKTHLSQLIAKVEATGEEVIIRRHNVPVGKLVPFRPVIAARVLGGWEGRVTTENLELVTKDRAMSKYDVRVLAATSTN